jgi:hypothetical protein
MRSTWNQVRYSRKLTALGKKKEPPDQEALYEEFGFLRLYDLAGLQAGGADAHPLGGAVHNRPYRTQVHIPAPTAYIMGVADVVSKLRPFAAHFAYSCHDE